MTLDAVSAGLSGIRAATTRVSNSAHNVSNLLTEDFHPLHTTQRTLPSGGSEAVTSRAESPAQVDVGKELVGQILAGLQFKASIRAVEAGLELKGSLLDIKA